MRILQKERKKEERKKKERKKKERRKKEERKKKERRKKEYYWRRLFLFLSLPFSGRRQLTNQATRQQGNRATRLRE